MVKLSKNIYIPLIVAGVVLVCFLIGGLFHVFSIRTRSEEQSIQYLSDATNQRAAAMELQVEGDLQVLRGVAISLAEMDLTDEETVNRILDTINHTNTFVQMGLAGTDGTIDLLDLDGTVYRDIDLSGYPFFQRALAGQDAVSETFSEPWSGTYANLYAVPVTREGVTVGVLCAAETDAIFRSIIATPVFQGEGYFAIIDTDGVLAAPTIDPRPEVRLGENVFDFVGFTEEERAQMAAALTSDGDSHLTFRFYDETQLATLVPLNFNDWHVISVVPRSTIYGYYNSAAVGSTIILIVAFLIFLLLLFLQLRSSAKSQRNLAYLAYTDLLTGQRNYTKFLMDAERLLQENPEKKYAVWNHDIRKFYAVNDVFGRPVGDLVLKRVASVFAGDENEGSLFCRIAADNFTGIRPYRERSELEDWFWQVIAALAEREVIPANQMRIDDVMGFYCKDDFVDILSVDEMVTRAGVAKRAAKEQAGNAMAFFNDDMSSRLLWETELEASAAQALASGQITFFLQPKVSIQGGYRVSGAEALARWNHPAHGRIPPDQFIPLFEQNGFVVEMDRALFERVCQWHQANIAGRGPEVRVAVNVSRQGLMRDDFVEHYAFIKQKYGIADGVLELEFTESVILDNNQLFLDTVTALQGHGFICSIDDFGSGYSSLNVLKNLPIDVLKLDAMFFRHSEDTERENTVVAGFLALAHQLHIRTVAEGVETRAQVEFLRGAGCDIVQGYVFARPMPREEYLAMLEETGGVMEDPA